MGNNKDVSLKAKLSVDLNTFKDFENKVKSLSKTFKNVQIEIAQSSQGMDKTIQQAFFGKRGTDRTTIQGFFKKQFKGIVDAFTAEIRAASKAMVDVAGTTSAKSIADMIKVLTKQEKEIEKLTDKNTKLAAKSTSGTAKKAKKYQLTDDDKAFRAYYLAERNFKEKVAKEKGAAIYGDIKAEQKANQMQLAASKAASKLRVQNKYADIKAEQRTNQMQIAASKAASKLKIENKYADIKAEQKANQMQISASKAASKLKTENKYADIKAEQKTDTMLRKQAAAKQKYKTQLLYDDIKDEQKANKMRYAENKRLEDEKKRLEAEKLENARNVIRQATGWGGDGMFSDIKSAPVKSFFDGIIKGAGGMKGAIESALGKLKELVKYLAIVGAAGIGGFIALGAVVQKLAAGVLFATEKMRGYEIALFGMMKTQDGVNELMEKAFKVTKNLPISYEQVYQSTKAFTLIGPVRDMLKNVGETETVLKRMYSITMALSQIEPEWGLAGAQFSLREALSGDLRSLQRRFEIPVNLIYSKDGRSLRELKNDPEAMSQALSDYFKEFYNEETLGMAANQFGAILGKIEGKWFEFQSAIGNAGFYDLFVGKLKEVRDELEAFAGSAEFKDVTNRISNSLGSSLESLLSIIEKLVVGFGRLFGINVEATNAFQSAVDVVEKFAAVLRIIDRIITEVDIFGYLNDTLKATKKIAVDVGNYLLRMFKSVKKDIDLLVSVIEKFTGVKDLFGDKTGKGLFYLWLFGPSNLFAMVSGFGTSLVAVIYTIKSAWQVTMAANTLATAKWGMGLTSIGATILSWGATIATVGFAVTETFGAIRFAFQSISDELESSPFYKIYMWMTGKTSNDELVRQFDLIGKKFAIGSENFDKYNPYGNVSFSSQLSKISGVEESKISQGLSKNTAGFLAAFMKREDGLSQIVKAIAALDDVANRMNPDTDAGKYTKGAVLIMSQNVKKLSGMDMGEIANKYRIEGNKLDSYDKGDKFYGIVNELKKGLDTLLNPQSSTTNAALDEMLKSKILSAEEALFKARSGPIFGHGEEGVKSIDSGAKILGAELINVFQSAGFGVGVTSGYRAGGVDTKHNVNGKSLAIDYQPNIGGKLLSAADVQTPQFEALVNALKANENIANLILEYKDTSIFGDKFKGMTREESTANFGPVMHIEFKEGITNTEESLMSMMASYNDMYGVITNSMGIINDEWNKPSKQLPKKDFLHQNFQRATEFIKNVYEPTMDAIKNGYKDGAELIATSYKEFDEVFKSEEGVAKFGPARINSLETKRKALMAQYNQIKGKAGSKDNIEYDLINQGIVKGAKDIFDYSYKSLMSGSLPQLKNIAGIIEERQKITKEYIDFIADAPNQYNLIGEQITKEVEMTNDAWGSVLEGKSYDYIDIVGSNIKEFQNDLMAKMAEEAAQQTVYAGLADGLSPKDQSLFYQAMGTVTSTMKSRNISFEEAIKLTNITDVSTKALMKTTVEHYKVIEQNNLAYKTQRMEIEKNLSAIKRINNIQKLSNEQNNYMATKEERTAYYSQYAALLEEGQGVSAGDSFSKGIQASQNEFLTSFQVMYEAGKELNSSLMQTFDQGFFGLMTGEIANIGDMFRNVAKSIQHSILKIISQMAAISATKMILGVDIQGALNGGQSSGGGLSGLLGGNGGLGGLIGGLFGSNKTVASGVDLSSVATSLGGGSSTITGNLLSKAASFLPGSNILDTVIKSGTAKTASSGGLLSKLGIGKITPLSGLGIAGALSFLSSPGRLFGGTKDKTAGAQASLDDYNARRAASINRRGSDAIGYYMGNTSGIQDYSFGSVDYRTWKSGDGWFKGPKEKHASTDASSYLNSMDSYYKMLMSAGQQHYGNMKTIQKTAETNSLKSLREQQSYDIKKLSMIKTEYDRYATSSYTAADKYEKMDDYRNQLLDQEFANWQAKEEILKLEKETIYKQMEYSAYINSFFGEDSITMAKTAIEIEKARHAEFTSGTMEWYESKMNLLGLEVDLSNQLKTITKDTISAISSAAAEIYQLAQSSTSTGTILADVTGKYKEIEKFKSGKYTEEDVLKYSQKYSQLGEMRGTGVFNTKTLQATMQIPTNLRASIRGDLISGNDAHKAYVDWFTKTYKDIKAAGGTILDKQWGANGTPMGTINYTMQVEETVQETINTYSKTLEEIIEDLNKDIELTIKSATVGNQISLTKTAINNLLGNVDSAITDRYNTLATVNTNLIADSAMTEFDRSMALLDNTLQLSEFYKELAGGVNGVIKSGYLSVADESIGVFGNAISDGFNMMATTLYDDLMLIGRKGNLTSSMLGTIKDMEDFSLYNQVMGSSEMSGLKDAMGGTSLDMSGYSDPYDAWFQFNKDVIQTRIGNSEEKSEEWFTAQNDLFNLMIENAEKMKAKAEEMNRSLEDMFGKIEETMRMRIAEEKQTAKGDVYFLDVGSTRNGQQMLDRMLEAVKSNDPKAMTLIEEYKKKMLGIGR